MRLLSLAAYRLSALLVIVIALAGCASMAVTRCDTIEDRDGKYFGRFFLGVATLGLSEVTIQQEEVRQAYEGSPSCPAPARRQGRHGAKTDLHRRPIRRRGHPGQRDPLDDRPLPEPGARCPRRGPLRHPAADRQPPGRRSAPASIAWWPARPAPRPGRCPPCNGAASSRSTPGCGASSCSSTRRILSSEKLSAVSSQRSAPGPNVEGGPGKGPARRDVWPCGGDRT